MNGEGDNICWKFQQVKTKPSIFLNRLGSLYKNESDKELVPSRSRNDRYELC